MNNKSCRIWPAPPLSKREKWLSKAEKAMEAREKESKPDSGKVDDEVKDQNQPS